MGGLIMAKSRILLENILNTACIIEDEAGGEATSDTGSPTTKKGTITRKLLAKYLKTRRTLSRNVAANKETYKGGLIGMGLGTAAAGAGAYALHNKIAGLLAGHHDEDEA
jgi:hypothetical protein